jgi:transcriptional regulator with PAS, ATPase and Fis domain
MPASDFLEILPDKSQKDKIALLIKKTETGWRENYEKKIVSSDWNGNNTLELEESINAFKEDLKLTFEIKSDIDSLPGIILGDLMPIGEFYDRNGYSISIYPLTKRICIKKRGYIIQSGSTINEVTGKYVLIKSGGFFLLTKDGEEILSFYDIHPIERTDLWITLFKRTDDSCSIDRILIEKRTSEQQETNEEIITYLRNSERTPCLLDRVLSFSLAGTHNILRAYRLRSITAFQSRITRLEKLLNHERNEGERLKELLSQGDIDKSIMIGRSREMQVIREKADKLSRTNISILIQGATGTGKEILAHYIHNKSGRAKGPFIKIDCSILPQSLIESELFGHEKGAFTGAEHAKEGLFESADGGTLFIDEISNLPMQSQAKLLQFLQDRSLIRLGGKKKRKIDTRIIVAANESLPKLVKEGRFREDLYYRFAVATFELPSLKERLEDLHLLCDYFLSIYSKSCGKEVSSLTNDAYEKMFSYSWPGNIRELRNVIDQAVLLCDTNSISAQLIRFPGDSSALAATGPEKMRKTTRHINANRNELVALLLKHKGSVIKCAAELEVTTRTLYYCLKQDNLNPKNFKRFVAF